MKRITLLVTGDLEKLELANSLSRYFPTWRDGHQVEWRVPGKLPCATSYRLKNGSDPPDAMKKLANAMVAEVEGGKDGRASDLVIVVDDVELGNLDQVHLVAEQFKRAVQLRLGQTAREVGGKSLDKGFHNLQTKCSFHVFKPMIESYFYAQRSSLVDAGVSDSLLPQLVSLDVEEFETRDHNRDWQDICRIENAKRQRCAPWWRHERHPKHYLEWLVEQNEGEYSETRGGRKALKGLNWHCIPPDPQATPLVRALFQDLSDWFEVPCPLGDGSAHPAFYPVRSVDRSTLLLRNM